MCEMHKPAYVSNTTHLEITFYHSLSDKKIKSIVKTFPNIIHLDFKDSLGFSDKSLFVIAESYPNLRYINLWDVQITDKGNCYNLQEFYFAEAHWITDRSINTSMLMRRCFNIEYLDFSRVMALQNDVLIIAIIKRSLNLRHLEIGHNDIGNEVIEALAYTCHKLDKAKQVSLNQDQESIPKELSDTGCSASEKIP
ncbi:9162_t:CDS:2, partial [Funneliformis geosporum]